MIDPRPASAAPRPSGGLGCRAHCGTAVTTCPVSGEHTGSRGPHGDPERGLQISTRGRGVYPAARRRAPGHRVLAGHRGEGLALKTPATPVALHPRASPHLRHPPHPSPRAHTPRRLSLALHRPPGPSQRASARSLTPSPDAATRTRACSHCAPTPTRRNRHTHQPAFRVRPPERT